jgi:hypothetical protein
MSDVLAFRTALHRTNVMAPIVSALSGYDDGVLVEAAGLVSFQKYGTHTLLPQTPESIAMPRSHAAMILVAFLDEMTWLRIGESVGYYEDMAATKILSASLEDKPRVAWLSEFDQVTANPVGNLNVKFGAQDFQRELALVRDEVTPNLLRCFRLVEYAGAEEWKVEFDLLRVLEGLMEAEHSLSVPPSSLEALTWGLSGAGLLYESDWERRVVRTRLLRPVRIPNERRRDLLSLRVSIADSATRLSEDQGVDGSRRIATALDMAVRNREGVATWAAVAATRLTAESEFLGGLTTISEGLEALRLRQRGWPDYE